MKKAITAPNNPMMYSTIHMPSVCSADYTGLTAVLSQKTDDLATGRHIDWAGEWELRERGSNPCLGIAWNVQGCLV